MVYIRSDKIINSIDSIRKMLIFQFDISWQLLEYNLKDLEDEECLWKPGIRGLHIINREGVWYADWPEVETYDIGPPSIAWLTWHIIYWWSMVYDYSFGEKTLSREVVPWPGNIKAVKEQIFRLYDEWKTVLMTISDEELLGCERTIWPFDNKSFYELASWLNLELMKNAGEIGYCRFLYASRK